MPDESLGFMARLKRHHIFRVASLYAVAAYILIQAANAVFPDIGLSRSDVRFIIAAMALLFPVALVLGWMFIPPSKENPVQFSSWQHLRWRLGSVLSLVIIVLVILSGVYLWRVTTHQFKVEIAATSKAPTATSAPVAATAVPAKSIAVLPFENLSIDKANAYFADGIQDLILTKLADIGDLRVISRTSTQQYNSRPGNLKTIAQQLGVATILEGSVQKAGNQVLINVQLIDASSDSHIWAESYTRTLDNIFSVEGEVAQKIADTLQAKLTSAEQQAVASQMTNNPEAYDAYLRGLVLESKLIGFAPDALPEIENNYAEAVKLDPNFAQAWARLSIIKTRLYAEFIQRTPQMLMQAKQAVDTALRINPQLGQGYLALARYYYLALRDMKSALPPLEKARQLLPNSADVLTTLGQVEMRQNKWQQANEHLLQASQLDPRSVIRLSDLAYSYAALNQFARAREILDRALVLAPNNTALIAAKASTYQQQGNLDAAGKLLDEIPLSPEDFDVFYTQKIQFLYRRDYDGAIAALKSAVADPKVHPEVLRTLYRSDLAYTLQLAGQDAAAHNTGKQALAELLANRKSEADDHILASNFAEVYAALGNKDQALHWAQRDVVANSTCSLCKADAEADLAAMQARFGETDAALAALPHLLSIPNGPTVADLRLDPVWDPLRKDARFQALLKKYANRSPVLAPES
ncbi:MAG: tetratricopeptide repeat protein [Gammaproteobacteria bacterium]